MLSRPAFVLLCLSSILYPASFVHGQVILTEVQWQLLPAPKAHRREAQRILQLVRPPAQTAGDPLGALVVLRNEGPKAAVGVLLRYAVSAKVAPIGDGAGAGTWAVPFWLEEARIPQIAAGKEKRFTLRNLHLEAHLKQLRREGYWPSALRLQIMAEPKKGEDLTRKILEAELPVVWEEKSP